MLLFRVLFFLPNILLSRLVWMLPNPLFKRFYSPSCEAERDVEQAIRNKVRLAEYYTKRALRGSNE